MRLEDHCLVLDERAALGRSFAHRDVDPAHPLRQLAGQKRLFPGGDRLIDEAAHRQIQTEINERIVGGETLRMLAPGELGGHTGDRGESAPRRAVDEVAEARGAVVAVIVVEVVLVFGKRVPGEKSGDVPFLRGR
jgi:hypothetical protein